MSTALQGSTMRTEFSDVFTLGSPTSHGSLYKEEAIVGNGAYGTVYKAREINNPTNYVALKKVRIPLNEDGVPVSILREISLIRQLDKFQHPNVVRFLDVCNGPRQSDQSLILFLVFEFVEKDLAKYIQSVSMEELTIHRIKDITFQILCGVDFLHSQRILHRDLKPQNLLVTKSGQIKLADFGLAKVYDFTMRLTTVVVTLWYRSPEVLLNSTYGSAVDVWSIGCIFAELFRRRPLFPGNSERDQLEKIFDVIGTPSQDDWPCESRIMSHSFATRPPRNWESLVPDICSQGEDLLAGLLHVNADKRLTAKEALRHPYFQGFSEPPIEIQQNFNVVSLGQALNQPSPPAVSILSPTVAAPAPTVLSPPQAAAVVPVVVAAVAAEAMVPTPAVDKETPMELTLTHPTFHTSTGHPHTI